MKRVVLFDIPFEPATLDDAADQIVAAARERRRGLVVTPNVDHVVTFREDAEFRAICLNALYRYADGMPLVWLSRLLPGPPLPERVTGADLLPAVCARAAREGLKVYFLGGLPGVAEQAALVLAECYPGLVVSGFSCPPFGFENDPSICGKIVDEINCRGADILFVGVGAPKQEKWSWAHLERLRVGPIVCVGAAFDFAAGTVKRAPRWVQSCGCEWLWRLASEPGRLWKRYLVRDSRFVVWALAEIGKARLLSRAIDSAGKGESA